MIMYPQRNSLIMKEIGRWPCRAKFKHFTDLAESWHCLHRSLCVRCLSQLCVPMSMLSTESSWCSAAASINQLFWGAEVEVA